MVEWSCGLKVVLGGCVLSVGSKFIVCGKGWLDGGLFNGVFSWCFWLLIGISLIWGWNVLYMWFLFVLIK